jgi:tetratricopeptide (TPR) repeat protein
MAQILKLPVQPAKRGYRRVRRRCKAADPNQLDLFLPEGGEILEFSSGLSPFEQALALDERNDPRAADNYLQAIEANDCVADALCNLGIIETQRRNSVKALDCFTQALKHDPRHSEAHYNLANLYFELDDFQLARVHFELAAEIDPEFANALFNLALVCAISNEPAAASGALLKYQVLVSEGEGASAAQMIEELQRSMAALHPRPLFPRVHPAN